MSFLHIDGITIPVFGDSFEEEEIDIADIFERTTGGRLSGSLSTTKRRWSFETPIIEATVAEKMKLWIEGRRQVWSAGGRLISGAGVGPSVAGTIIAGVQTHIANGANVGSGSQFGVNMGNKLYRRLGWLPTDGWTMGFWTYRTAVGDAGLSDGWYSMIAHGAVAVTRGASANPVGVTQYRNGVALATQMGNYINVLSTGNYCGWTGHGVAGGAGARDYEDGFICPFEFPATAMPWNSLTWAAEVKTFMDTNLLGAAPIVKASGSWFTDALPVNVICRVKSIRQRTATLMGATVSTAQNRKLQVVMEEV